MIILLRQRPRRFSRACMTLFCIAAVAMLTAESAAAQQNCFLFFCPPGAQPGWQGTPDRQGEPARPLFGGPDVPYSTIYAESNGEPFPVPALRLSDVDPTYLRRSVYYPTDEQPGTIVIDPQAHFLYLVEGGGRAIRYGVGVGRSGFEWSGVATVHNKQEWPDWYPPKEMIERQPEIRRMMSELQSGWACTAVRATRSAPAHCTCGKTTRIRSFAFTALSNPGRSARASRPDVSA